jgi:uncharacterized protein (DUF3084 family)
MKAQSILITVVGLALAASAGTLLVVNRNQSAEVAQLRKQVQDLEAVQTQAEETARNRSEAETQEVAKLRKDREELLRLRGEVGRLRQEQGQLNQQVQSARAQVEGAQAQIQALRTNAVQTQLAAPAQALPAGSEGGPSSPQAQLALQQRYGLALTPEQTSLATCVNNLRQIDGAKQQWALEHQKGANDAVIALYITPYIKGNALPVCPSGGAYTLNSVGQLPTCTIPGHALPVNR